MLSMFSKYYKIELKNKLKNKTISSWPYLFPLSLQQHLSLPPHLSQSGYSNLHNSALSLSPYLHPATHSLSLLISPDQLSLDMPATVLHLYRHCNSILATVAALSSPWLLLLCFRVAVVAPVWEKSVF